MNLPDENHVALNGQKRANLLIPILSLWGLGAILLCSFLVYENGVSNSLGRFYLLPWALVSGLVVLSPSIYLHYKGKFDLFHPLVYSVWIYVFPAFVLGAFILMFEWTDPYFLSFIKDQTFNLPLSLVYVCLGFIGVIAGFYLPIGRYVTDALEKYGPKANWSVSDSWLPGILLIFAGIGMNIFGFFQGLLGFQRIDEIGAFDGLFFFLTILFTEGFVLLWLAVFKADKKTGIFYLVFAFLIIVIPLKMAIYGNRGSLMSSVIPVAMAFWYSGRRLKWQHSAGFGVILFLAILIGITYGTTFRHIKGSEARMNAGDYVGQIAETLDYLSRTDSTIILSQSVRTFAERVENLSSLGVVVANYEELEPYEESYGLKNNIRNDLLTSLIPRFLWSDKPMTSDPRAYSDLYFNYGENSFAITPFGDLLRNFGVIGIPLGMMIIGIYFRIIYVYLIDTPNPTLWKTVAYYPLLTVVSFEGFYAVFFPTLLRTLVILVVSLLLANLLFRKRI